MKQGAAGCLLWLLSWRLICATCALQVAGMRLKSVLQTLLPQYERQREINEHQIATSESAVMMLISTGQAFAGGGSCEVAVL